MIRRDEFTRLRDYSRGYTQGASKALCSEFALLELEAAALVALDAAGADAETTRAIIDQARHEVRLSAPEGTSDHDVRALAAQRIVLILHARAGRRAA